MDNRNKGVYIPLHEAARVYGYTRDHLGYLIRKGDLRGEKLGSFYFTTHEWVKNYVLGSGKARKEDERIRQKKIAISESDVRQKKPNRQITKKIINEFKEAIKPLILDIGRESKKFIRNFTKLPYKFNSFVKTNAFRRQIIDEVKLWREEGKYLTGKFKKLSSCPKLLDSAIRPLRKTVSVIIFLPRVLFEASFFVTSNGLKKTNSSFKKIHILAKKIQREIAWTLSGGKSLAITNGKKENRYLAVRNKRISVGHQALGPSFVFLGIFIFCLGILPIITPSQGWDGFLMTQLNSISNKVYLVANDLGINNELFYNQNYSLKNLSGRLSVTERRESFSVREFNANNEIFVGLTESANILAKKAGLFIENISVAVQGIGKNLNKSLANLSDVSAKLIGFKRKIENNTNKGLIVFETKTNLAIEGIKRGLAEGKATISNNLALFKEKYYSWQSLNNSKLAQIDNRLAQIKKIVLANISGGAREQLAQLRFSFDFITKSFQKIKNYFAGHSETNKQIGYLDERIKNLESQKVIGTDDLSLVNQNQEGLIVVPSVGNEEEQKKKLKAAFSDEVVVEPDETGQSGIIKPVFKKQTDQKYLYMLVPMAGK